MTAEEIDEFLGELNRIGRENARKNRQQQRPGRSPGVRHRRPGRR